MTIGLILAPVAVNMAMGKSGDGALQLVPQGKAMAISMLSLTVTIGIILKGRGMFKLLPILCGILAGYALAAVLGVINFNEIVEAPLFAIPAFTTPEFNLEAILYMLPIAIAPAVEHLGDMLAISSATKENYLEKPGLKNTLLGDGLATSLAAAIGGPPNTTYSEVTGVQSCNYDLGSAICDRASLRRQARRPTRDNPGACNRRRLSAPVWHYRQHRHTNNHGS